MIRFRGALDWIADIRVRAAVRRIHHVPIMFESILIRQAKEEDALQASALLRDAKCAVGGNSPEINILMTFFKNQNGIALYKMLSGYRRILSHRSSGTVFYEVLLRNLLDFEVARRNAHGKELRMRCERAEEFYCKLICQLADIRDIQLPVSPERSPAENPASPSKSLNRPISILIVHGTWGGRKQGWRPWRYAKPWYDIDSEFISNLTSSLGAKGFNASFTEFQWSGANSILHRWRAASKLAEFLRSRAQQNCLPHTILAHSHGGNVALKAIDLLKGECGMYSPDTRKMSTNVVTLATPFLQVFDNPVRSCALSECLLYTSTLICFHDALTLDTSITVIKIFLSFNLEVMAQFRGIVLLFIIEAIVAAWAASRLVFTIYFTAVKPDNLGDMFGRVNDYANYTNYDVHDDLRLLILRGVSDEASLALAAGGIASRITHFVDPLFSQFAIGVFAGAVLLAGAKALAAIILPNFVTLSERTPVIYDVVFSACGIIFISRLASRCMRLGFGRELFLAPHRCEFDSAGAPDKIGNVTIATLAPSALGATMNHSVYANPLCPEVIADWLSQHW